MPPARTTKTEKEYLIVYNDGRREKLSIPAGSRVTFGKLTPPAAGDRFGGQGYDSYAVRVYEGGEGIQLGVFPDVKHFRDLTTLKVERLTHDEHGNPSWEEDEGDDITSIVADALGGTAFDDRTGRRA